MEIFLIKYNCLLELGGDLVTSKRETFGRVLIFVCIDCRMLLMRI